MNDRIDAALRSAGRTLLIGEVAQAHDGSLGLAHAFIDTIAAAGLDAVKFQTHIAAAESTHAEGWRVPFSRQDATRYDYWKRMEFTPEQWAGLKAHADERGLLFLSSPFSVEAADLLERIGVPAWKIASGEVTGPTFDRILESDLPVLLSTGMSPLSEIDRAVSRIRDRRRPLVVLQCTSGYPCPPEAVGLNLLSLFSERYGCAVGLSDHSGTIYAALAAVVLGASAVEVHVTLSREMFGPDVAASLTPGELRQLVEGVRAIERMLASPVDKDAAAARLGGMRQLFMKSLVARRRLPAGTIVAEDDLTAKKPGGGLAPGRLPEFVGRRVVRDVAADEPITEELFESRDA